ncbi:hypothetical protein Tco_1254144 [Tanacetum coccineum]
MRNVTRLTPTHTELVGFSEEQLIPVGKVELEVACGFEGLYRRTMKFTMSQAAIKEVGEWVKAGIVRPVEYPTLISDPVLVKKFDEVFVRCRRREVPGIHGNFGRNKGESKEDEISGRYAVPQNPERDAKFKRKANAKPFPL